MGGSSWLTAVKRAFRSPTKDSHTKISRRRVDHQDQQVHHHNTTEKRRWLFKKKDRGAAIAAEQKHAIAMAEAAYAAAKAAVEIIRQTRPPDSAIFKRHSAARLIQTAFRGFLARKALRALKGIVRLQALVRGQNVRRRAHVTMKCMQSLLRLQSSMARDRSRTSHDGGRRSMFAETCNFFWISDVSVSETFQARNDWGINLPRTLEELEEIVRLRNQAAVDPVEINGYCGSRCPSPNYRRSIPIPIAKARTPRLSSRSVANTPRISSCIPRYATSEDESLPNYMAPTESAKARIRSQSVPRQREATPETDRGGSGVRKRLTYSLAEPIVKLRSPSFKSVNGLEELSICSCCGKSSGGGGEISVSSCSTTELRGLGM